MKIPFYQTVAGLIKMRYLLMFFSSIVVLIFVSFMKHPPIEDSEYEQMAKIEFVQVLCEDDLLCLNSKLPLLPYVKQIKSFESCMLITYDNRNFSNEQLINFIQNDLMLPVRLFVPDKNELRMGCPIHRSNQFIKQWKQKFFSLISSLNP